MFSSCRPPRRAGAARRSPPHDQSGAIWSQVETLRGTDACRRLKRTIVRRRSPDQRAKKCTRLPGETTSSSDRLWGREEGFVDEKKMQAWSNQKGPGADLYLTANHWQPID